MSLYRLDFRYPDGSLVPVADRNYRRDYLSNDRARAITYAKATMQIARAANCLPADTVIVATRIYGAGLMRDTAIIDLDGKVSRPVNRRTR